MDEEAQFYFVSLLKEDDFVNTPWKTHKQNETKQIIMFVKVTVLTVVVFISNCHNTGDKRKQIYKNTFHEQQIDQYIHLQKK